jgi:23S rRNA pseudouridine1911/1915/1917 synthase
VVSAPRRFAFVVDARDAGDRLDRVCAAHVAGEGISRSSLEPLFGTERVRLNDRVAKASTRVREGDRIAVEVPPLEPLSAAPEAIPLEVLFEDEHVLVVNKPAGLVVHPAKGHASGTLVNAVLHHATVERDADETDDEIDALRPGIVHRLDKDTSGVMVVAKTAIAREGLKAQFQAHSIEREYVAITIGVPPDGVTYETLHGRHPTDRKRFSTRVKEGKRAVTTVRVREMLDEGRAALVACTLKTGRTHQIRVHLAEHGFPILADALYGKQPRDAKLREAASAIGRQALHARVLGFVHPMTGKTVRCVAEPPEEFARAVGVLRGR